MPQSPATQSPAFRVLGAANVPESGCLIVPNRLSAGDLALLRQQLGGRRNVLLYDESQPYDAALQAELQSGESIGFASDAADASDAAQLSDDLAGPLAEGCCVIFVPGSVTVLAGTSVCVPAPTLSLILATGQPTVPLFVEIPKDVALSIEEQPRHEAVFSFAEALAGRQVNLASYLENLLIAGEAAFRQHPIFEQSLAYSLIRGLKKHGGNTTLFDGNDGGDLRFDKAFAAAAALSRLVRKETDRERVGIVLPPGKGGLVANLAVLLAGKVPVNLNFTAGAEAVESSIKQAEIDRLITADAFMRKVTSFPWPPNKELILLDRVLPALKKKIIFWLLTFKAMPAGVLAKLLGVAKAGGDQEAVLLFTSGSSGAPKGVVLTHRNLLANVTQFGTRLELQHGDRILGCLPLFHSFGSTVTLWYPILEGIDLVTYPSPLETPKLAGLIEKHKITLLLATPTFLRGYMRRVEPQQLASLRFVVTGAEKLPLKLAEAFSEKFGIPIMEGYGLTETSPVSTVNMPDPEPASGAPSLPSYRFGSVGQLLPGMAIRITDAADDQQPLPVLSSGMIWLRGSNIFTGYLKLPQQTEEVLYDGWFRTGDIGRLDEDGFLFIEGRLSRFSKIGGEMVPHETVEAAVSKALGLDSEAVKSIAVIGIPHEAKGEALVLLTTAEMTDQSMTQLRYSVLEQGLPSLWVPKRAVRVEEVPVLASGKLDIKRCEKLARSEPLA